MNATSGEESGRWPNDQSRGIDLPRLLFAFFAAPIAWAAHLMIIYPLVYPACERGLTALLHVTTIVFGLLALAGGIVSWQLWERTRESEQESIDGSGSRAGFMAFSGVLSSVLFFAIIVLAGITVVFVGPCE